MFTFTVFVVVVFLRILFMLLLYFYIYCFCCCCIFTYTVSVVVVFLRFYCLYTVFFGLLVCSVLTVLFSFIPFFFCVPECGNGCVLKYIVWILMDFKNHLSLQIIFFSSSWLFSCTKQRYWYLKKQLKIFKLHSLICFVNIFIQNNISHHKSCLLFMFMYSLCLCWFNICLEFQLSISICSLPWD